MSWGYRVTILTLGFVGFMTFLVVSAFRQKFDLVTEDYYGKELKFQNQIEKQTNQSALNGDVSYTINSKKISIMFPSDHSGKLIEGEIFFFRPSNAEQDIRLKIPATMKRGFSVPVNKFKKGLYKIQIDYRVEGKEYYYENSITID